MRKTISTIIAIAISSACGVLYGQTDPAPAGPYLIFDLNNDGFVDNDDVNIWSASMMEYGTIGRGGPGIPITPEIANLDFDANGFGNLADAILILDNFGHFAGSLFFPAANGCQLGDFNADSVIDSEDMDEFEKGLAFWQWWNAEIVSANEDPALAIYGLGDVDMNGVVNEIDFGFMRLLWTAGVQDFDSRYQEFPDPYTSPHRPCLPFAAVVWMLFH